MAKANHRIGEDICNLLISGNMGKRDDLGVICVSDVMTIHFNVFDAFMVQKICCNLNCASIVAIEWCRL